MSLQIRFLLSIDKALRSVEQGPGAISVVIQRPFSHLEEEFHNLFDGHSDVRVILDNRDGDRRVKRRKVGQDRRRADRRSRNEEVIEVIMST
jgi:hypothetical protein